MKSLLRALCIALGVTTLYLLWIVNPLISTDHLVLYHWDGTAASLFIPAILAFCTFWLLLTALLLLSQRSRRFHIALWSSMVLFSPWIALKNWALISGTPLAHQLSIAIFGVSLAALILLLMCWRPSFQTAFERILQFITILLYFAAISGAVMLCELLWFAWLARSINTNRVLHRPSIATAPEPTQSPRQRIIWILLDELSYQQVFERRFPGLQLPAFDQLASEATVFTHVVPAGIRTEKVVPSLMTGLPVDDIRSSSDGFLSIHNPKANVWQRFDPHNTIFQDAHDAGYHTAIAGWYNPYCRIMPDILDHCFWTLNAPIVTGISPDQSTLENLLQPMQLWSRVGYSMISHLARIFSGHRNGSPFLSGSTHIHDYINLAAASDRLLEDSSCNFIFLHMPVPHPGGIYNRSTARFDLHNTSYLDNLALADTYLAHVRSLLQQTGDWDSSTIVVMGDHSWRTKLLWALDPNWTTEEKLASHGGQFDDRPGFIVKMPHQHHHEQIDTSFEAVRTRSLLNALLTHQLKSPDDLRYWAH
jgi:Sulfatase